RASYGTLGNQDVSAYAYIATMEANKNNVILDGLQNMYVTTPGLVSGNLTWEKVATTNVGIDLNMFGNRFQLSADYYIRDTKGMLSDALPLPSVLGTGAPKENVADLRTKGWEFTLSWKDSFDLGSKPFNYGVNINLSDSRAKITKMIGNSQCVLPSFGNNNYFYEGMEIGEMWGYETLGLFQSDEEANNWYDQSEVQSYGTQAGDLKFNDVDGDKKITKGAGTLSDHGDMQIIGNTQVRYRFGTTLTADWNGFDLRLFFQGVLKHQFYPYWNNYSFWGLFTNGWGSETYGNGYDSWTPDNQDAYFPRLKHCQNWNTVYDWEACQTRFIQNGAYVRLKNVTFGYTLPKKVTDKIKVDRIRFFYSGDNLFTLSGLYKYSNLDPEDPTGCAYPFQRHNSFGINITF
ncbi:MAG: SusC/RagA family TonB-linked outer membrane protein, partial [Bacteroidaceae bacterium]|nr:SusC/RagA family TonB-linked outer membrane protein [Bacteroidaceae bacterium]